MTKRERFQTNYCFELVKAKMTRILENGARQNDDPMLPAQPWGDDMHESPRVFVSHHGAYHHGGVPFYQRGVEEISKSREPGTWEWNQTARERHVPAMRRSESTSSADNLRQRLANANDYFRRKASEVYNDQEALDLLKTMDRDVVVDIANFDACSFGVPLSKLTAANFCEIGAKVIFITEAGQRFLNSLRRQGGI